VKTAKPAAEPLVTAQANDAESRVTALFKRPTGKVRVADLRRKMTTSMEEGCGIYRDRASLDDTCRIVAEVRELYRDVALEDKSAVFNTDLYQTLELGCMIEVAQSVAVSAAQREESRGAHQRLDFPKRDDEKYLKHSMAYFNSNTDPRIEYADVTITKSQPAERVYGAAAGGQAAA
jgi:fumarate reductase flavoprotein subunit